MSKTQTQPQYVNLQPSAVQVYDEKRRPVTVLPWSRRAHSPDGLYVVEGVHYQQFVSGRGPLYPFPADPTNPGGPLGETADAHHARIVAEAQRRDLAEGLQAAAKRGTLRLSVDVVRQGEVVGETQEAFAARLRPLLLAAGLVDAKEFDHASKELLLSIEGVNQQNLPRVREMAALIYGEAEPESTEADPNPANPMPGDAEVQTYSRAKLANTSRKTLVAIAQEEFDGLSVDGTAAEIRERLLAALAEHNMLTD